MIGASQMEAQLAIMAWLVFLHIIMGAAVAGTTLTATNIALKLSPKGSATAYIAANALATALAAGLAPILGGLLADFFATRQFELMLRWTGPKERVTFDLLVRNWDFYFLLAGAIGLYALHRLTLVEEHGEIEQREMITHVLGETRRTIRNVSTVAGLRAATDIPASLIRDARVRLRLRRAQAAKARGGR